MALAITEIHKGAPQALNEEWFILENPGDKVFNANGCDVAIAHVAANKKPGPRKILASFKPGFVLKPGERIRIVTGSPTKKTQGEPPPNLEQGQENYHLHLGAALLKGAGDVLRIMRHQLELAGVEYQPDQPKAVASLVKDAGKDAPAAK
jgi:hypothetical protein